MGRGSTQILIQKIVECLTKSSKSITEIAEETDLDRTAIIKYLNILKEGGLLLEEQKGTSKIFTLAPTYRTDTYFGLPLDEKTEKDINSLFYSIGKNWMKHTTKKLLRTHAQKIAYKVISLCDLKIPSGWYIYGGISIVSYDDSQEYNYYELPKEVEVCVEQITVEYVKNEFAWQSKKQQYEEAGKNLYLIKEEILSIIYSPEFDKHPQNSLHILAKKIRKLISLAPKDPRQDYGEILDSYQDLMFDIPNKINESLILEHKRELIVLFEAIWKYIALFNFKNDLKRYYSEKILNAHFELDILQQEDEIIELGTQLQSLIPEEEITDPLKKQLHEVLSNIRILSPEEKKKQKEKIDKLKKKLGNKKFQEYLLNEVGL